MMNAEYQSFPLPEVRLTDRDRHHSYRSPSSASSSASSVFSVEAATSQTSEASAPSATSSVQHTWDNEDPWAYARQHTTSGLPFVNHADKQTNLKGVADILNSSSTVERNGAGEYYFSRPRCTSTRSAEDVTTATTQRPHPRRCSGSASLRQPPSLVRQSERKVNFVDNLVDSATQIVEAIWPLSVPCRRSSGLGRGVLPLRTFIQETLRRSRTSYSTLQVALYYLILIKSHIPTIDFTMEQPGDTLSLRALQCGRRMFLASLILASKYLQDRNYSARAWSKISGLKVCEINSNEITFCEAVNWKLHIVESVFERWTDVVLKYTPSPKPPGAGGNCRMREWKDIIPLLTPDLDVVATRPTSRQRAKSQIIRKGGSPLRSSVLAPTLSTDLPAKELLPLVLSKPPMFLEPKPELSAPAPPPLLRMATLPTPQLTPQSASSGTPAASTIGFSQGRSSMCSAMAQAQCQSLNRTALDQCPYFSQIRRSDPYRSHGRPSSLASTVSSSVSSPESMVSDVSSRSSRSSSISSVSCGQQAPPPAGLARMATCRNMRLPLPEQKDTSKENASFVEPIYFDYNSYPGDYYGCDQVQLAESANETSKDFCTSQLLLSRNNTIMEETSSADGTPTPKGREVYSAVKSGSRKRGRSSMDMTSLQQNVRAILRANSPSLAALSITSKAVQSPTAIPDEGERRRPVQKDLGRKRACCASEVTTSAAAVLGKEGPGMWEGVL